MAGSLETARRLIGAMRAMKIMAEVRAWADEAAVQRALRADPDFQEDMPLYELKALAAMWEEERGARLERRGGDAHCSGA